jgi:hypothetical protein
LESVYRGDVDSTVLLRAATRSLDGCEQAAASTEGIDLRKAEPLVPILVTTRNSLYRLIPLRAGGSPVLVQGGRFFPEPTQVHLAGSTFGGSALKLHWIAVGMHLEIEPGHGGRPITTTRIAHVRIERDRETNTSRH